MSLIIPKFDKTTPLEIIIKESNSPIIFLHNHSHQASYEILGRLMSKMHEIGIRRFFLEVPEELNKILFIHFNTLADKDLNEFTKYLMQENQKKGLTTLIQAAHLAKIQVIGVDALKNSLTYHDGELSLANKSASTEAAVQMRLSEATTQHILNNIRKHTSPNEKYCGLFGGQHTDVPLSLPALSVSFIEHEIEGPCLSSDVEGADPQTAAYFKKINIIYFAPPIQGVGELNFSKEIDSKILNQFNQLLEHHQLPPCKAYKRENRTVDAVMIISSDEINKWEEVQKRFDGLHKALQQHDEHSHKIIFYDIESAQNRRYIITNLVKLIKP